MDGQRTPTSLTAADPGIERDRVSRNASRQAPQLGLASSNIIERRDGLGARRGPQERLGDVELASVIRRFVEARPTYGYWRIAALLKRERRSNDLAPVNAKRVYRLMKKYGLLLERHTGRRRAREHDGQVVTICSNCRWCSDALEFSCWNGRRGERCLRPRLP